MSMDVKKLLRPNKVAVVGASDKEGFGGDTCRNMIAYMKEGDYYFINPRRETVLGQPCYPSIEALPEPVELLVICTPQATVPDLLRQGAQRGVRGAVVYASGYGEVGTDEGRQAEADLKALCEELGIALMGPNCAGFVNFTDMMYPFAFVSNERERKGHVGVISQSGQLILSMLESPRLKFSYAISAGNSKIVTMEDYLQFLVDDESTRVIAVYLEGVTQSQKLVDALRRAAELHKPVVVLKAGRSEKGQAVAASHTGSLAGADKVFDALFEKFGVVRVDDLEELMSTAQALATLHKLPQGDGLCSVSLSGGETGICADVGEMVGIRYPNFTEETLQKLRDQLPGYATPNNPLDSTATLSYDTDAFAGVLETVMRDPGVDMVSVGYTLLQEIADPAIHYMSAAMEKVSKEPWSKPLVIVPFAENTRHTGYTDKLERIGVPVLPTTLYAFKIIRNILRFANYRMEDHDLGVRIPTAAVSGKGVALTESESKTIVRSYGIPYGDFDIARSREQAAEIFTRLGLSLSVMKIDSVDILHKSDVGCVKLGIKTPEAAAEAYDLITANAAKHCPDAHINGVQVCDMVPQGAEMIVGVTNDPQFGPCVLCGLGGVFVEVLKDSALALAPLSEAEAQRMVRSLKGIKLLEGYRGEPTRDIDALAKAVQEVGRLACERADDLQELDINPLFVYEKGVCAADALYIKKGE